MGDKELAKLLRQILSQPKDERKTLLNDLCSEAKAEGAPSHFIDFLSVLQDSAIADKVAEFLEKTVDE